MNDAIAQGVIDSFQRRVRGKPVVRSNGVEEWTVLSGVVAIIGEELRVLAVTTGVKALPDNLISKSKGKMLHDCHAEILALRALNCAVVAECKKSESDLVQKTGKKFRLKDDIKFALYISEPPCGDGSLELLVDSGDTEWDRYTQLEGGVLRGRECYGMKGKVRTKPGRKDSPVTLSKSCSDKLALKQYTGVLNSVVSQFVEPLGFHLTYLVLPGGRVIDKSLNRCFRERLNGDFHEITILETSMQHEFQRDEHKVPSSLSLVHIPGLVDECINNFVKEGFYSKKKVRKGGESAVSRHSMLEQCQSLLELDDCLTYYDIKRRNTTYHRLKTTAQESLGNWNHTTRDDFAI